mmetsp:Transcript_47843/g.86264  ORF Transcript_47843/g.86264 Transcript_47843/m.86264 type:complete len:157 (-) Transcript_47843:87-557(-)
MVRSRSGSRFLGLVLLALAVLAGFKGVAFAPFRAAALAGVISVGGMASDAALADVYQLTDSSNLVMAQVTPGATSSLAAAAAGRKAGGGLAGTYEVKEGAKKIDFVDDEKTIQEDEKFQEKFDQYIGVFGILFVGAFIAPMVTYFWYVRDSDPWEN